jgi:inner membrane protein
LVQGPVLCIPFTETITTQGKPYGNDHLLFVTPDDLKMNTKVISEIRTKGIFNTVVYTSNNQLTGSFNLENIPQKPEITYHWSNAILITGITDPAAISDKITTQWNNTEVKTMPGVQHLGFATTGFHSAAPISTKTGNLSFSQEFSARGTTALRFLPTGKTTDIDMNSNWPSPSFSGRILPQERTISAEGFEAHWDANEYNRKFPDHWIDTDSDVHAGDTGHSFGVNFIQTADHYQKNMRSAKYAILVITLSFLVFFFYEIFLKIRIHPIQYMMIGFSLAIFYALLLSFTEHIGFNAAYLISAGAVTGLIAMYAYAILQKGKFIGWLTALFVMLYGYIFILLQLEDYALLAGTVGLFAILATVMMLSRKMDWYKIGQG